MENKTENIIYQIENKTINVTSAQAINKAIKSLPRRLRRAITKKGEKFYQSLNNALTGKMTIREATLRYGVMVSLVILTIAAKSQTTDTRGQNELNVVEFHALTDPSCTALGLADNQEKLTTHAFDTQDYLNATDTRLIDMAPFCRVDQETTTTLVGTGYNALDLSNLGMYVIDPTNNCNISDIQYFYTDIPGYEEFSMIGEPPDEFCRAVFSGGYDNDMAGPHAYTHVSGAVGSDHDEARYEATYTVDLTGIGGGIYDKYNGKTIGASDNSGGAYLPFYCTPEAYNKDTPANGGDGFHYFNTMQDNDPAWIATDQMNNNTGYTETTTGIYDFLVANPEKIQEESVDALNTPIAQISNGTISLSNVADFDVEYPNTTESSYQGTYYTEGDYRMYLYDYSNSADGQFIAGPVPIDSSFSNLSGGNYVIRIYEWWGNGLSSVSNMLSVDTTPPTSTMSGPDTTNLSSVIVTQEFSEPIDQSTLTLSDYNVSNGAITNINFVSDSTAELTIEPTTGFVGDVEVELPVSTYTDLIGNENDTAVDFEFYYDGEAPDPDLSSTEPAITNATSFPANLDFPNEPEGVTGVEASDFWTDNCAVSNVQGSGNAYTYTITPDGEGEVKTKYQVDMAQDPAENENIESEELMRTVDWTSSYPTMSSTAPDTIGPNPITVNIEFTNGQGGDPENVNGFTESDIGYANCTLSNFSGSGSSYTVELTPSATGIVTLSIGATVCTDDATNDNVAGNDFEREADLDRPTPSMDSNEPNPTGSETFIIDINFDEGVEDFGLSDITADNANLDNLVQITASTYTVEVSPIASGTTTVSIAENVCTDLHGNLNIAAQDFNIEVDYSSPASDMESIEPNPTNADDIDVNIPFNKAVVGFEFNDLVFTNSTGSDFTIIDDSTYSVIMSPAADGVSSIDIPEGVCTDNQGNENIADYFDRTSDRTNPQPTITTTEPDPTAAEIIPMFFDFYGETNIIGFDESDIEVSGGVLENFAGNGTAYTADIVPNWPGGLITVGIAAGTSEDATGNQSISAETFTINSTVNIAEQNIDGFKVYPNPANKQFTVESNGSINTISIYNQFGQSTFQKNYSNKNIPSATIDIQNWAAGIYLVQVVNKNGELKTKKLIVQY